MSASVKRGRPSTGVPVLVRIPADLLERIDRQAIQAGITRAEMVRTILADWFD